MPRLPQFAALATGFCLVVVPAKADDILNALDAARGAYENGDIAEALQELSIAQVLLQQQKTQSLESFLPEAPEGWSREIDRDMSVGLSMFGGGTGAEATYSNGPESISIMLVADSPMVASFGALLSNPAMLMATGGTLVKVGDQRFAQSDSEYTSIIANRILIQASGENPDSVKALLEQIDFAGLQAFAP